METGNQQIRYLLSRGVSGTQRNWNSGASGSSQAATGGGLARDSGGSARRLGLIHRCPLGQFGPLMDLFIVELSTFWGKHVVVQW